LTFEGENEKGEDKKGGNVKEKKEERGEINLVKI
jgi:hypothetical protein